MNDDSVSRRPVDRRRFLQTGAALTVAAAGLDRVALAQGSGFDWKRFKGEKIEVSLVRNPRAEILQRHQKEFEDLTGMSVGLELVPEQQHRQKQVIEFNSGKPGFDVTTISWHVQKRLFGKGKWLEDLRPMLADRSLVAPDFLFDDFARGAILYGTQADGRIDALPLSLDYFLVYWNKDLFRAKGLDYPKSYDDLVAAAGRLNDPGNRQYGFVGRGLKNANTYVWCSLMLGWGEDAVKPNGELNTDGPAAIAAAEYYKRLCKDLSPPGTIGFNWNECQTNFAQGNIGMWADSIGFAPPLEDATKSKVVGKVGYGVVPAGPRATASGLTGDGIGVAAGSTKKAPAFLYVQWATSKAMHARFLQGGAGAGARTSLYADASVLSEVKAPKAWVDCVLGSSRIGRPCFPNIIPVTEFRDTFGVALTNMIGGADAASELRKATAEFRPVLEKSERS